MLFFFYVLRKLVRRLGNNAVTVAVIGLVLAGCIIGMEFVIGLKAASHESLPAENVVVVTAGVISDPLSAPLPTEALSNFQIVAGVAERNGQRAVSPEVVGQVLIDAAITSSGFEEPQVVRGVDPIGLELHRVTIISGRAPAADAPELVIGAHLAKLQPRLTIGSELRLPLETFKVVGVFAAGGSVYESEAWGDRKRIATALKLERANVVVLEATSPAEAANLAKTLDDSKRFKVTAELERELRGSEAKLAQVTRVIFFLVLALCVIGVFVTATNLHASLISRLPELVTLVAVGVPRNRVARIMLLESLLLAGFGFVVAVAVALAFHGRSSTMFGSAAVFDLQLGMVPVLFALGLAAVVGVLGGLVPIVMVRRINLVRGLRG